MKYHCKGEGNKSLCGLVTDRPDTFIYELKSFLGHNNIEMRCKICDGLAFIEMLAQAGQYSAEMDYPTRI